MRKVNAVTVGEAFSDDCDVEDIIHPVGIGLIDARDNERQVWRVGSLIRRGQNGRINGKMGDSASTPIEMMWKQQPPSTAGIEIVSTIRVTVREEVQQELVRTNESLDELEGHVMSSYTKRMRKLLYEPLMKHPFEDRDYL